SGRPTGIGSKPRAAHSGVLQLRQRSCAAIILRSPSDTENRSTPAVQLPSLASDGSLFTRLPEGHDRQRLPGGSGTTGPGWSRRDDRHGPELRGGQLRPHDDLYQLRRTEQPDDEDVPSSSDEVVAGIQQEVREPDGGGLPPHGPLQLLP